MKRILITGKNSYVGTKFMEWVSQWPDEYQVDAISVRGEGWKMHDFNGYDSVLHVAGIAHIKETRENRELYYKVNRDLAFEVAKKSKEARIPHFVFLSSMSVYGLETGIIDSNTVPDPKSAYGKSKLEAELLLKELEDESFHVALVRPPMIYGPNCPGNYARLSKLAKLTPIFPKIDNKRSMIYIDNLSEMLKIIIDMSYSNIFLSQNEELVSTKDLVFQINKVANKKVIFINTNSINKFLLSFKVLKKMFGSLIYNQANSKMNIDYQVVDFESSIINTENREYYGK